LEGVNAIAYYYPQMLDGAGVSSVDVQLLLVGILGIVGLTGTLAGAFLTDRIRRRTQLLTTTVLTTILITIVTVLNATNILKIGDGYVAKSGDTSRAQIAMFFLFVFVFCVGWSANQVLYPLECLRFETRAKGMSLYMVCLTSPFHI
jgi:predicted MFS family arabinose efflux permease